MKFLSLSLSLILLSLAGAPDASAQCGSFGSWEINVSIINGDATTELTVDVYTPGDFEPRVSATVMTGGCLRAETNGHNQPEQNVENWYFGSDPSLHLLTLVFTNAAAGFSESYTYDVCNSDDKNGGFGFYCSKTHWSDFDPGEEVAENEDTAFYYDAAAGVMHVVPTTLGSYLNPTNSSQPDGFGDLFPDDNWALPYAMEDACEELGLACSGQAYWDVFISPHSGDPATGATATPRLRSWDLNHDVRILSDIEGSYGYVWDLDGEEVRFYPGKAMTVVGNIDVGAMTLTEAASGQGWNGLSFEAGSTGTLTGATVRDVDFACPVADPQCAHPVYFGAVSVYNAAVTLDGTTVTGTDGAGIITAGSAADVTVSGTLLDPSVIRGNGGLGVQAMSGAAVRIDGGTIIDLNTAGGVRGSGSGTTVTLAGGATVQENVGVGVDVNQNATGHFESTSVDEEVVFVDGNDGGVSARTGGHLNAGQCDSTVDGGADDCRHMPHEITFNAPSGAYFDARSLNGSTLFAEGDYWGPSVDDPSDLVLVQDGSSYLSVLPIATTPGVPAPRVGGGDLATSGVADEPGTPARGSGAEAILLIAEAERALALGDTTAAGALFLDALTLVAADAEAGEDDRRAASEGAARLLALVQPPAVVAWLEGEADGNSPLRPWARRALAVAQAHAGLPALAESTAQALVSEDPEGEHGRVGHGHLVRLAVEAGSEATALARLSAMASSFAGHEETAIAAALVAAAFPGADVNGALNGGRLGGSAQAQASATGASPSGFALSAVRPNPVSGTATLPLSLAEESAVEAVLYDALGRRIALVYDGALGAGEHALALEVASLPPGVYVVHVTVRSGGSVERAVQRVTVAR